jgi:hypothetical protein
MAFWALENADDSTRAFFGVLVFVAMLAVSGVALYDWIKRKK